MTGSYLLQIEINGEKVIQSDEKYLKYTAPKAVLLKKHFGALMNKFQKMKNYIYSVIALFLISSSILGRLKLDC
jgi:hypothetical protein